MHRYIIEKPNISKERQISKRNKTKQRRIVEVREEKEKEMIGTKQLDIFNNTVHC